MNDSTCPLCQFTPINITEVFSPQFNRYECNVCGEYYLSSTALNALQKYNDNVLVNKLSLWIRNTKEMSLERPEIYSKQELDDILSIIPSYTTSEKQLLLMRAIERKT